MEPEERTEPKRPAQLDRHRAPVFDHRENRMLMVRARSVPEDGIEVEERRGAAAFQAGRREEAHEAC